MSRGCLAVFGCWRVVLFLLAQLLEAVKSALLIAVEMTDVSRRPLRLCFSHAYSGYRRVLLTYCIRLDALKFGSTLSAHGGE